GSGIGECRTGDGDELPRVARGVEYELQDAVGRAVAHLAVRARVARILQIQAAGADDELADADGIGDGGRRLRGEPLVDRVVRVHDDIGVVRVERVPQRLDGRQVIGAGRADPGAMPVGERALLRVRR